MMTDAQISVGDLTSFLLYTGFVGVSVGGKTITRENYGESTKTHVIQSQCTNTAQLNIVIFILIRNMLSSSHECTYCVVSINAGQDSF
jgi:NAD dependent epimerase/dehydratase family enzyme